ncbi:hypothetical protein [Thermospira aquatica]|uniref:Mor transcription activator domain-containing protein n=1 Tax=Thermospira aquatica TaxID=2828656 RepID=A0AAX3BDV7_9SPIR|nr:hypothetical protein [Thermospira aquatica]URA10528.1 hypothetical protein KDW03_01625 [Thermospira aquatica]
MTWEQIYKLSWRCGGSYLYVPKFPERIERYKNIIAEFKREMQVVGRGKALLYISRRKKISIKTLKRLLNNSQEIMEGFK